MCSTVLSKALVCCVFVLLKAIVIIFLTRPFLYHMCTITGGGVTVSRRNVLSSQGEFSSGYVSSAYFVEEAKVKELVYRYYRLELKCLPSFATPSFPDVDTQDPVLWMSRGSC